MPGVNVDGAPAQAFTADGPRIGLRGSVSQEDRSRDIAPAVGTDAGVSSACWQALALDHHQQWMASVLVLDETTEKVCSLGGLFRPV
jgi:hypothetical protein